MSKKVEKKRLNTLNTQLCNGQRIQLQNWGKYVETGNGSLKIIHFVWK